MLRLRGERLKNALLSGAAGIDYRTELSQWLLDIEQYLQEKGKPFSLGGKSSVDAFEADDSWPQIPEDKADLSIAVELIDSIMDEAGV